MVFVVLFPGNIYIFKYYKCSLTMICSVRLFRQEIKLLACLFTAAAIVFFLRSIFTSMMKSDDANLTIVRHKSNCRTGSASTSTSIYCSSASQAVTDKSHSVFYSSGIVAANEETSSHSGSVASLLPLGTLPRLKCDTDTVCASSVSRDIDQTLFHSRKLVIWSADHHPAPAYDARHLLEPLGVRFLQHDLSPYCGFFNLCAERTSLKVINAENMFSLDPALIPKFYEAYKNVPLMQSVDAFLCYDPPAICELYEPFNKSLIVIATNRYYITRQANTRWKTWNENLVKYASDRRNVIAANNRYDVEMIRYFTGLNVELIPNFAGYTRTMYNPSRKEYLLAKRRVDEEFDWLFLSQFKEDCKLLNRSLPVPNLIRIEDRYPRYKYADLAAHRGVVHLPYQVSTMSIFEQYRMNIPLFFPSKELLLQWSIERWVVRERTLPWLVRDPRQFTFPPHSSQQHVPSPNDNDDAQAMKYWLQFADFYTLPHITYFNSTKHLAVILQTLTISDLKVISWQMKKFNEQFREELLKKWRKILQTVAKFSPNHPH